MFDERKIANALTDTGLVLISRLVISNAQLTKSAFIRSNQPKPSQGSGTLF